MKILGGVVNHNIFPVIPSFESEAHVSKTRGQELSAEASSDPSTFWKRIAERLDWFKFPTQIRNVSYYPPVKIEWFSDGEINLCHNCVDRHLPTKAHDTAILFEPDSPEKEARKITYQNLFDEVQKWSRVLKHLGVQKGDRVTIYMPLVPEAIFSMLACARLGAIHSVVFGGFAPDSILSRVEDADSKLIITADFGHRGGKVLPLKKQIDEVVVKRKDPDLKVLVYQIEGEDFQQRNGFKFSPQSDHWFHDVLKKTSPLTIPCEKMNAEDPLFLLYTSGSTGKPKGVLHTTGGYLVYASYTHEIVFDYKPREVYWCTADVGWITGHSYVAYGPLANGATTLIFEGVPHYPTPSRFWEIIDKHQVNIFYTAPTALRALMKEGDAFVQKTSRQSLRLLGTVGEPINPEAWVWYHRVVGEGRCPVVDTWWQTETGGILISPLPGATDLKPGSATKPLPGVFPVILSSEGKVLEGATEGLLVLKDSWPGQMRTVYKDHQRFEETYFKPYPGYYFTGDGCRRDEDGYYWITGRVDDVLNVSGHRLGTAELESVFVAHPAVAEAAVVGYPHDIKGQGIYAYVTLRNGFQESEDLRKELVQWVRKEIGPIATPDKIQWAPGLPKTRSGKIMRRILRKIAEKNFDQLGDTSTLADPGVVKNLIQHREGL
jgi:acetyl-CoA synthetase